MQTKLVSHQHLQRFCIYSYNLHFYDNSCCINIRFSTFPALVSDCVMSVCYLVIIRLKRQSGNDSASLIENRQQIWQLQKQNDFFAVR